jgi:hypothetical protein
MRLNIRALTVAAILGLAACTQVAQVETTVCTDLAKIPPGAAAALDAQDPHSAIGVLWADAKAACANGVPAPGVSADWGGMIWGELKVLIPQVLPSLLPLLLGLL